MKNHPFSKAVVKVLALVGILGYSCGNSGTEQHILDSIKRADSLMMVELNEHNHHCDVTRWADSCAAKNMELYGHSGYVLEDLLDIKDETELKKVYGADKVKYDTIWGAEGFFTMGTILKTDAESRIEITWENGKTKTGIISVTLVSDQDWYSDTIKAGMWYSNNSIGIGMKVSHIECVNGRPFTFSGFGWDYAGSVIDWQKGNLEGKGIAVQLSEGPTSPSTDLSPEEIASVLGDVEVQSDNPVLKHYRPRVWSISVAKVQ